MFSSNISLKCSDGKNRKGYIRGKHRKRLWFNTDDVVLITKGQFSGNNDEKCTVELKYYPDQIQTLKSKGYLKFIENENDTNNLINFHDIEVRVDDDTNDNNNNIGDEILTPNNVKWESNIDVDEEDILQTLEDL
jgi:translation initiation factor 1A